MSINTEFYTNPSAIDSNHPTVLIADWEFEGAQRGSIGALVKTKNEVAIPLDDSIIPWKIGLGADFARRYYALYIDNAMEYKQYYKPHNDTGFRFFIKRPFSFMMSPTWKCRHNNFIDMSQYTSLCYSFEGQVLPIVGFDYHNTLVCIRAMCLANNDIAGGTIVLKTVNEITQTVLDNYKIVGFRIDCRSGGAIQGGVYKDGVDFDIGFFDEIEPSMRAEVNDYYGQPYLNYCASVFNVNTNSTWDGQQPTIGQCTFNLKIKNDYYAAPTYAEAYGAEYGLTTIPWTVSGLRFNQYEYGEISPLAYHYTYNQSSTAKVTTCMSWYYNELGVDGIKAYMMQQAAFTGFLFTDSDLSYIRYGFKEGEPERYYVPIIDQNGITTGEYQPYPRATAPNKEWGDDIFEVTPYDPRKDDGWIDPNAYDDNTTALNDVRIIPEFATRYILTSAELRHAHQFLLEQIATNVDSDYWSAQTLYTNNPIDVVQSVLLFPFDISQFQTDEPSYRDLTFGQLTEAGYSVQLNREQCVIIDMGSCTYYPTFGRDVKDFRNYPPYSSASLYIPYCGSVDIDPNLYMGSKIGVKYIVDMCTGSCLALIYRNNMVVDSISGTMGISVPLTGIQTQTLANAERQAETGLKQAKINGVTQTAKGVLSVAGGFAMGTTAGLLMAAYQSNFGDLAKAKTNYENAKYDLEHVNVPYKTIGTATAATSFYNERKCRLIIRRPVMLTDDLAAYAHTVGISCIKAGNISDFTGYTEFQSVDLSGVSATSEETAQLYKLLQGGVYL